VFVPVIRADGGKIRECIASLSVPGAFGFIPLSGPRRPFDVVFLKRRVRLDHVAILVRRGHSLMFLHCIQGPGGIVESEFEMKATTGSNFMDWYRHKDVTEEMAECLA
jgi:hypothetical protein